VVKTRAIDQFVLLKLKAGNHVVALEVGACGDLILVVVYSGNAWLWNVSQFLELILAQIEHLKTNGYNQVRQSIL